MTAEAPDIGPLLHAALARYNALSPVDKALHDSDQRRSFVHGQIGRDPGPDVLAEEVRRLRAEIAALREECAAVLEPFAAEWRRFPNHPQLGETGAFDANLGACLVFNDYERASDFLVRLTEERQ